MTSKFTYLKRVNEKIQGDRTYPYDLYLSMEAKSDFICIGEGSGHGSMGCSITPEEFISGERTEYIKRFDAMWLDCLIRKIGPDKIKQTDIIDYWKTQSV